MHVWELTLDFNWFLQLIITAFLVALGIIYLVKNTSSRYLEVGASLGCGSSDSEENRWTNMPGINRSEGRCIVCGKIGARRCSGCKTVRYCSRSCQSEHWESGHKSKCKELLLTANGHADVYTTSIHGRRTIGTGRVALIPGGESSKIYMRPKQVLFSYDEFMGLFIWDKLSFPPCGLLNCGNSCFANVVLQCLTSTRPLVAFLVEKAHQKKCRRNGWCFLCELQMHVDRVINTTHPFSPISILSRLPNIGGNLGYGNQEDAHEFMRLAIDTMQSVCLEEFGGEKAVHPSSQETTIIQHIFGGHLQSQVICSQCNRISDLLENMMDLTVEIHGDTASLEECLEQFTGCELLQGENMYKCEGCNGYVKASKRLTVHQAPNILTVALKRFQSGRFGKLNKRISFPETLDLNPFMSERHDGGNIYELYAVVVHLDMLNASFFGHYICYVKDFKGDWYKVDDDKVRRVELEELLSQSAYMLLYSRANPRSTCLGSIEASREKKQSLVGAHNSEPRIPEPTPINPEISGDEEILDSSSTDHSESVIDDSVLTKSTSLEVSGEEKILDSSNTIPDESVLSDFVPSRTSPELSAYKKILSSSSTSTAESVLSDLVLTDWELSGDEKILESSEFVINDSEPSKLAQKRLGFSSTSPAEYFQDVLVPTKQTNVEFSGDKKLTYCSNTSPSQSVLNGSIPTKPSELDISGDEKIIDFSAAPSGSILNGCMSRKPINPELSGDKKILDYSSVFPAESGLNDSVLIKPTNLELSGDRKIQDSSNITPRATDLELSGEKILDSSSTSPWDKHTNLEVSGDKKLVDSSSTSNSESVLNDSMPASPTNNELFGDERTLDSSSTGCTESVLLTRLTNLELYGGGNVLDSSIPDLELSVDKKILDSSNASPGESDISNEDDVTVIDASSPNEKQKPNKKQKPVFSPGFLLRESSPNKKQKALFSPGFLLRQELVSENGDLGRSGADRHRGENGCESETE